LLIRRELPIADSTGGGGRWSLDHLFVTRNAVPVLVELKRADDTRLRREVVGQLLDYAANGVAYWEPGRIAADFATTCDAANKTPEDELARFLGDAGPDDFWAQVDANFQAGRIKLVFVADVIPPELARIVEFLNEQMHANVRAVELNWYEGEGTTTLVPHIIGETQRAAAQKSARAALPPVSVGEWIQRHIASKGDPAIRGAYAFTRWIEELGGTPVVGKLQGSIQGEFRDATGTAVAPLRLYSQAAQVELAFRDTKSRPGLRDDVVRQRCYDAFKAVLGPFGSGKIDGGPSFKVAILADDAKRAALPPAAQALIAAALQV
jgi:hypothetical protein